VDLLSQLTYLHRNSNLDDSTWANWDKKFAVKDSASDKPKKEQFHQAKAVPFRKGDGGRSQQDTKRNASPRRGADHHRRSSASERERDRERDNYGRNNDRDDDYHYRLDPTDGYPAGTRPRDAPRDPPPQKQQQPMCIFGHRYNHTSRECPLYKATLKYMRKETNPPAMWEVHQCYANHVADVEKLLEAPRGTGSAN
jgi:hypothetical protein